MSDKGEWIRVEDRLPEPETMAIVTVFIRQDWKRIVDCGYYGKLFNGETTTLCWSDGDGRRIDVTHWMLMPQPPEVDDE